MGTDLLWWVPGSSNCILAVESMFTLYYRQFRIFYARNDKPTLSVIAFMLYSVGGSMTFILRLEKDLEKLSTSQENKFDTIRYIEIYKGAIQLGSAILNYTTYITVCLPANVIAWNADHAIPITLVRCLMQSMGLHWNTVYLIKYIFGFVVFFAVAILWFLLDQYEQFTQVIQGCSTVTEQW